VGRTLLSAALDFACAEATQADKRGYDGSGVAKEDEIVKLVYNLFQLRRAIREIPFQQPYFV
jgi:hypothetical protein